MRAPGFPPSDGLARPSRARTILAALVGAFFGFFAAVGLGGLVVLLALRAQPQVEPSEKAAWLANAISEGMNATALAALVTSPLGAFGLARWARRRAGLPAP